jgi:hypothetical protein
LASSPRTHSTSRWTTRTGKMTSSPALIVQAVRRRQAYDHAVLQRTAPRAGGSTDPRPLGEPCGGGRSSWEDQEAAQVGAAWGKRAIQATARARREQLSSSLHGRTDGRVIWRPDHSSAFIRTRPQLDRDGRGVFSRSEPPRRVDSR